MTLLRRAILLCETGADDLSVSRLAEKHHLSVVYTVHVTPTSPHAPMIALQHIADHGADVVIIPQLTRAEVQGKLWTVVTIAADIVTFDGLVQYAPLAT